MTTPPIVSRFGNRVIDCPTELLTQLQHERQRYHTDIESTIREARHDALLSEAERIRQKALL